MKVVSLPNAVQPEGPKTQRQLVRIRRLFNLVYPTVPSDVRNQLEAYAFIGGMQDKKLQHILSVENYQTLSNTILDTLEYETSVKMCR